MFVHYFIVKQAIEQSQLIRMKSSMNRKKIRGFVFGDLKRRKPSQATRTSRYMRTVQLSEWVQNTVFVCYIITTPQNRVKYYQILLTNKRVQEITRRNFLPNLKKIDQKLQPVECRQPYTLYKYQLYVYSSCKRISEQCQEAEKAFFCLQLSERHYFMVRID